MTCLDHAEVVLLSAPSGVVEYLSSGGVDCTHKDFKELRYSDSLTKFNCNGKNSTSNGMITHGFKLKSAYENGLMPYTNYTFDFKVIVFVWCAIALVVAFLNDDKTAKRTHHVP